MTDIGGLCNIDRYNDGAADNGKADKHVAAHAGDSQEDGTVHANRVHVLVFICLEDGLEPGEKRFVHRGRLVLFVDMAEARGVYDFIPWSQDAEGEEDGGSYAHGGGHGGQDGCGSNISAEGISHEEQEFILETLLSIPREDGSPRGRSHCGEFRGGRFLPGKEQVCKAREEGATVYCLSRKGGRGASVARRASSDGAGSGHVPVVGGWRLVEGLLRLVNSTRG